MGRHTGPLGKVQPVSLGLPPVLIEALDAEAEASGRTRSQVVRAVLGERYAEQVREYRHAQLLASLDAIRAERGLPPVKP